MLICRFLRFFFLEEAAFLNWQAHPQTAHPQSAELIHLSSDGCTTETSTSPHDRPPPKQWVRIAPHCEHGDGPLPHPISFQAIMLEYSLDSSDDTDTNHTHTPSEACISCAPLATPQLLHYLQWELIYFCILISLALLFLKKSHKPFYHSHLFVFDMSYSDLLKSTPFYFSLLPFK